MNKDKQRIDLEQWFRKDHYHFFKSFDDPFFGVTAEVECTSAYNHCRIQHLSFFLYYLYQSLSAANQIESFRLRIIDDELYCFDQVHASPTIQRDDGTFGFAYMDYHSSFELFLPPAQQEINRVKLSRELFPSSGSENVIHYSALPWISFTSLSHARRFSSGDSCPKISFGKLIDRSGLKYMPVSVHAHHALMDGYHVGLFLDLFQKLM